MACSIVASHTRGSSTYGLRNEAGNARHRSRWPHQHPWLLVLPHPYTFPHICILAYHLHAVRIWAEGSSSSRNRKAPAAFVFEVVLRIYGSFYEKLSTSRVYYVEDTYA